MKRFVLVTMAIAAMIALGHESSAQQLFEGVATFSSSATMAGGATPSEAISTYYYRGNDLFVDMPQNKLRTLYLAKEKKQYTVTLYTEGEPRTYPARVFAEMVLGNSKDKSLKKNQQNNYIESITARGDAAYTYNIQHHHGVDFESESISMNARRSTAMASSRNSWS